MYGAILGDIIGSPFEFDRGDKTKDFTLFTRGCGFTDDSVMTIAVAEALMKSGTDASDEEIRSEVVSSMKKWGRKYPDAGYGGRFIGWLSSRDPKPYGSYGNGSAMRVSAAGWLYDTLEQTRKAARLTAEVTHNHPEGIKGAESVAAAIFMARNGASKDEIRTYTEENFGYDLSRACDEIRPGYHHVESCQKTVPEAFAAFLEGRDFEDVIRTAVSLGGDCDTLTAIAGSMAEAYYEIPEDLIFECRDRIDDEMLEVIFAFERRRGKKTKMQDPFLSGNEKIRALLEAQSTPEVIEAAVQIRMKEEGHFLVPAIIKDGVPEYLVLEYQGGGSWMAVFTDRESADAGIPAEIIYSQYIDVILNKALCIPGLTGIVINPWTDAEKIPEEAVRRILDAE